MFCGIHTAIAPLLESSGITALIGPGDICTSMEEVARKT
jgi:hypothetical protein